MSTPTPRHETERPCCALCGCDAELVQVPEHLRGTWKKEPWHRPAPGLYEHVCAECADDEFVLGEVD